MPSTIHTLSFQSLLVPISSNGRDGTVGGTLSDFEPDIEVLAHAEPEFRVVTARGERKGVRLEPIFWHVLDIVAADMGMPRNALALAVMGHADKSHANATSLLRSFLIAYMIRAGARSNTQPEISSDEIES